MNNAHTYHKPTLASLDAQLARNAQEASNREDRINACEVEATDCALSMWANGANAGKFNCQLELAKKDWKSDFMVLYRNGVRVKGKEVLVKFAYQSSYRWCINGEWFPSYNVTAEGRKLKNFQKHGFSWVRETLPAHVEQSFGNYLGAPVHSFVRPDEKDIITVNAEDA
jgi:hypothetical protein